MSSVGKALLIVARMHFLNTQGTTHNFPINAIWKNPSILEAVIVGVYVFLKITVLIATVK